MKQPASFFSCWSVWITICVLLLTAVALPLEAVEPNAIAPSLSPPVPFLFSKVESRSISPGNPTGAKGGGYRGTLHPPKGRKPGDTHTRHAVVIGAGKTCDLADIEGPGMIRSIWLTFPDRTPEILRSYVIRIYWDDHKTPSVECPIGDFFGLSHGRAAAFKTPYLGVSEGKGFHCHFPMPFSGRCRITIENDSPTNSGGFFYQILYTVGDDITAEMGRFHASFRRNQPPKGKPFVMLDRKGTKGIYLGAVISALPQSAGTWREGDIRFYIDGDTDQPTIVGTGWSDWFLSGWGLGIHQSTYAGSSYQVKHPEMNNKYFATCYRMHVLDPIYFHTDLRVQYTQIGSPRSKKGFSERSDDWCSTVYWYQQLTDQPLPPLPDRAARIAGIAIQPWEKRP